ncbi:protein kinase domain-containing protein [Archangium primigenium]|uniref:protein kinase domain-containing protein n=1 Tax=[Archangium] primigenium TaxID=2792470 RepID=UPI00195A93DF|nr:protein kinase [Archangium primigenium]MBM7119203.1 protein kinase [Archangium primigenium]
MNRPLHPNQLSIGHHVRDFRIVRRLGVGGYAFVFLVERASQLYVLKMAAQPASATDVDRVDAWMRREVLSLESLEHPHLLPVLEWGRWPEPVGGYGYFVMPYKAASTFHEWRWRERAALDRCMVVLCEHLKTLEALHARGVCHRDIKADNILVRREDDMPLLIDFGAAHLPWARPVTEGLAPGTLYCQPPEAIAFLVSDAARKGERLEARPSADLYAFGVLLYETLTNCRPFSTALTLDALLVTIATTSPLEPQRLAPGVPAELCALTMRLLAKKPEHRPPSARVVREELERLLREEGHGTSWKTPAQRPSECARLREQFPDVDRLEQTGEDSPDPSAQHRAGWPRERARRLLMRASGLVLLLGLGWMILRVLGPPITHNQGTSAMPSPSTPSRPCTWLTHVVGLSVAQLLGCATVPTRPDPEGYLARCSPEARATPAKLGLDPRENPTFLDVGTPASDLSVEDGGALNLKSGPVTATMYPKIKGVELETQITGEAVTTPVRVYIQFNRLRLPDGTTLPICGVAVDAIHQYGIPTYAKVPFDGNVVDPALVDKTPGSVVLNVPRFETVLQGPEGYPTPLIDLAPPGYR